MDRLRDSPTETVARNTPTTGDAKTDSWDESFSVPMGGLVPITANAMAGAKEKCLEVGATGYVSKPIDIDILTDVLTPYLPNKAS